MAQSRWSPARWRVSSLSFSTLHYLYIILASVFSFIVIYPYGNMRAMDAYFFGASGSTESGLNTIDVKQMKTYQQLVIYFIPIITQMGFINIVVIAVRLYWFEKHLKEKAPSLLRPNASGSRAISDDEEARQTISTENENAPSPLPETARLDEIAKNESQSKKMPTTISFSDHPSEGHRSSKADNVQFPRQRDPDHEMAEIASTSTDYYTDAIQKSEVNRRPHNRRDLLTLSNATSIEKVANSMFVIGSAGTRSQSRAHSQSRVSTRSELDLPRLSSQVTVGRNSQFLDLLPEDRERLGGIEYRALKLLLKICIGYVFGLHLFGAICLVGWIQYAPAKYLEYLEAQGQNKIWWAFYSAQTMVNNLGFTLTADSMITFNDATFPLLVMTFLAYAGHNFAPVFLRLIIWTAAKLSPKNSSIQESLNFLLDHPRRCCTLLFPSGPTWILFSILTALNVIDVILIVCLDLNNEAVTALPLGPRVLAAIFQAASSRHTGTATFNLALVNPAVQFSLLVMMYISVYPIAIAIRASNTYEEQSLGIFAEDEKELNEKSGVSYVMTHLRNQLSFDLWYIFLGIFCICVAESARIMDVTQPAYSVFSVFFEITSAYGNVGLSLGHPDVNTSLSGKLTTFSKIVICAMMIRGRHRGLPYRLDRAIMLPNENLGDEERSGQNDESNAVRNGPIERFRDQEEEGSKESAAPDDNSAEAAREGRPGAAREIDGQ